MLLSIFFIFSVLVSILFLESEFLVMLISLEFINLGLFFSMMYSYAINGSLELIIFLTFIVIEALVGLMLLVMKVFVSGDDFMKIIDVI